MKKKETFEKLHGKPISRRDFLASGLIPFSAGMMMPSWMQLLAQSGDAKAQELVCASGGNSALCPFISIKLSGGMAMSSNFVPFDQGLQMLPTYSKMGLGKAGSFGVIYEFANRAPFYEQSGLLQGLRATVSRTTFANSVFVGVPVRCQDDSANNKFDITGLVSKTGLNGKILKNLGRANTETGVNNLAAYVKPASPLVVRRYEDIVSALGVSGSLAQLSQNQRSQLFSTISRLTASQTEKLQNMSGGKTLTQLIQCANIDNQKLITDSGSLNIDPLANQALATAWGINNQTNKSSQDFVFATMVYNALNGNAGTINLEIGGFDYHNNTRTSGDAKDLEAGMAIGRALESLAIMGRKGYIMVTSDGGVNAPESDVPGAPWTSDRGIAGTAYIIAYEPNGRARASSFQIGQFTTGQAADDKFVLGGGPEIAAAGIYANYLAFNGATNAIETYLPRVFTTDQLSQIVKIAS